MRYFLSALSVVPLLISSWGIFSAFRFSKKINTEETIRIMGQEWVDGILKDQWVWILKFGSLVLASLVLMGIVFYALP